MATIPEVESRFSKDLAALPTEQRLWLQQHAVQARLLSVRDTPNEPVVVVGQVGNSVIYWSEFEEGWELTNPDASGDIATRGSSQFELTHVVERLFSAREQAACVHYL